MGIGGLFFAKVENTFAKEPQKLSNMKKEREKIQYVSLKKQLPLTQKTISFF